MPQQLLQTIYKILRMPLRRKRSRQLTKRGIKHSGTIIANMAQGSNAVDMIVLETSGGARSIDGSHSNIQSFSSTDDTCRTGDKCSLVNLKIQIGGRQDVGPTNPQNRTGWIEWAFVCVRENETVVPATNLGIQTLGDICTSMYRAECIYTGAAPVGELQPVVVDIALKIPKHKSTFKLGDQWRFITFFRALNSASSGTTEMRLVKSFNLIVH